MVVEAFALDLPGGGYPRRHLGAAFRGRRQRKVRY
jgi:hypothetical protein